MDIKNGTVRNPATIIKHANDAEGSVVGYIELKNIDPLKAVIPCKTPINERTFPETAFTLFTLFLYFIVTKNI